MNCSNCGEANSPNAIKCDFCGYLLNASATKTVPNNAKNNSDDAIICPSCGTPNEQNATICCFCEFLLTGMAKPAYPEDPNYMDEKCPVCMHKILSSDSVCQNCGSELFGGGSIVIHQNNVSNKPTYRPYPWHTRAARTRHALPTEGITIPSIPDIGEPPSINWLAILAAPVLMAIVMVLIVSLTDAKSMLYMLPLQLVSVVVSIFNYRSQKNKHKKKETSLNKRYEALVSEKIAEIKQVSERQRKILEEENPSINKCYSIVESCDYRLWERGVSDDDFMRISIGMGLVPLCVPLKYPEKRQLQDESQLETKAREFAQESAYVKSAPVLCDLLSMPTLGIIGDRQAALSVAKKIIVNISTLHSYQDVRIIMLYPQSEVNDWDAFRFLPHVFDEMHETRFMACERIEAAKILEALNKTLIERFDSLSRSHSHVTALFKPHYLLIIADPVHLQNQPIQDLLTMNNPALCMSTVFLFNSRSTLPTKCSQIIEVGQSSIDIQGRLFDSKSIDNYKAFVSDRVDTESINRFVRGMAPIRVMISEGEFSLPYSISLLKAHKVRNPESLHVIENWYRNHASDGMSVPIGVTSNGEFLNFDIHEKKSGPMGLIAGSPGSGKTELLQTWITEMAIAFSPDEVSFALIDFKGSGLTTPFKGLPHLAGAISNLDIAIGRDDFILRYAASLRSEITRRQVILRDSDCEGNILKYHRKYHENLLIKPLPFLMIVIDEFAEIKAQYPEFRILIESIYAQGRSLGMYVLLASQHPSNVVTESIRANTSFQWCLRVASSSDSKEMLNVADAADIPEIPGRGFVRVDKMQIFEKIQAIWSGAPYDPTQDILRNDIPVAFVRRNGTLAFTPSKHRKGHTYTSEVDVIIDHIKKTASEYGIQPAHNVWQKNLPSEIGLDKLEHSLFDGLSWINEPRELWATVGIDDCPTTQEQKALILDFSSNGHGIVFGAPMSGKSTFLYTVLTSLTTKYSPEALCLYLVDFNSMILSTFQDFPHVAASITSCEDSSMLEKILQKIEIEIKSRISCFASKDVGTYRAYCDTRTSKDPSFANIVLVIDGIGELRKQYANFVDTYITKIAKEGASRGIYLLVSAAEENDANKFISSVKTNMKFVLQMANKGDYSSILGSRGLGITPLNVCGRGIHRLDASVFEFQTALPATVGNECERMRYIKTLGITMREVATTNNGADATRTSKRDLFEKDENQNSSSVILGYNIQNFEPVVHDFTKYPALIFIGYDVNHASACMSAFFEQSEVRKTDKQILYCITSANEGSEQIHTPDEMEKYLVNITNTLRERIESWKEDKNRNFDAYKFYIYDLPTLLTQLSEEAIKILAFIMRNGKKINFSIVCSGSADNIAEAYQNQDEIVMWFFNRGIVLVDRDFSHYGEYLSRYIILTQDHTIDGYYLTNCENGSMNAIPFRTILS